MFSDSWRLYPEQVGRHEDKELPDRETYNSIPIFHVAFWIILGILLKRVNTNFPIGNKLRTKMIVHNSWLTQELTYYRPQLVYIKNVFHAEKFIE